MSLPISEGLPYITLPDNYQVNPGVFLASMYEKHGPIFRTVTLWGDEIIYLVGPEANRFVLATNRHKFSNYEGWNRTERAAEIFGKGLIFMDGLEHIEYRRIMAPAFSLNNFARYIPLMNQIIKARTANWVDRGAIDIYDEAYKMTFDVAATGLMGFEVGPETEELRNLFQQLMTLDTQALNLNDELSRLRWIEDRRVSLKSAIDDIVLRKIQQRRAHPADDLINRLNNTPDSQGTMLTDEQVIAQVKTLLMAGHITTSSLCAWLVYMLGRHPDYLERVLREQDELLDMDSGPTVESIKRMELLENALLETERIHPPIATLPRLVVEPFEFNNYSIPEGAFVFCSISGSHMIPSVFANPEKFDPDRFAAPRQEHLKTPHSLVGFSDGPRVCLGITFARTEIKTILSHVLRHFNFELDRQEVSQLYHPFNTPIDGIPIVVTQRERKSKRN
jgi:retinoid hydroxylase